MPSFLPILHYDIPVEGEPSSVIISNEPHIPSSSSVLKKHTSVCQELPEKKKKAPSSSKPPSKAVEGSDILPDSGKIHPEDGKGTSQGMGDAVKVMKTAVYAVQMALYNGLRGEVQLKAATQLLTKAEYADVVEERSIDKRCGYPLCYNDLKPDKAKKGRYRISLSQHKVYDIQETKQFCSTSCAVMSQVYGASLKVSHEEILVHEKLEEIIACVRDLNLSSAKMNASSQQPDVKVSPPLVVRERSTENETAEFEFSTSPGSIEGYTPRKYVSTASDGKPLKSAMKQSPRKHQRITWADEILQPQDSGEFTFATGLTNGDDVQVEPPVKEEESSQRLSAAQDIAEALARAASASSAGEVDASEAISSIGLSIIAPTADKLVIREVTAVEETPLVPAPVSIDSLEDDLNLESAWYDSPPKGYSAEVSSFGMTWVALDEWVSTATLAYIYNRENDVEEFRDVNGREVRDLDSSSSQEIHRAMCGCISRALPEVVRTLGVSVPLSVLEQSVGRLLQTMNFIEALPAFTTKHWRMICVLFLDALSVRMDSLDAQLANNRSQLRTVLRQCGTGDEDYEAFKELLLPLGRLPSFSTMRGG